MKKFPLLVLLITIAIDLLGFGIIIPVLPIYADSLGAPEIVIGMIATSFAAAQFLFTPFWGGLSDRIGRRPVILISVAIMAVSYVILANATVIWMIFLARIVAGIGAANHSVAQAFISDMVKPKKRIKYFGYLGAALGIGFILGPPLGGFLKTHYGVVGLGYVAAAISAANFILAYVLLPESNKHKNPESKIFRNPVMEIYRILPHHEIRSILMVHFVFVLAFSMMQITASLLWSKEYSLNEQEIGTMFAYVGISTALIQGLFMSKLNTLFGERKMFILGNLFMAVGLATLPFVPENAFLFLTLISLTLIAFGHAFVTPTITSLLSQNAERKEQGKILGLAQSVGALSRTIGPSLGGFFYGLAYFMPNIVAGIFMLLSTFLAYQLVKNRMRPQEAS